MVDITKKGYSKDKYGDDRVVELAKCMVDPIYFSQKYIKIQHPMEGRIPFKPYDFQIDMLRAFHEYRNVIALTSRQMGKCNTFGTIITKNNELVKIGSLFVFSLKTRLVNYLEQVLLRVACN